MIVLLLAGLGLCLGSFVNALVWRLHARAEIFEKAEQRAKGKPIKPTLQEQRRLRELSIWHGRSMCPHCRHQLSALDLIPVLSWLSLRGRCRYCHAKIDDTPFAELVTPAVFVASYLWWPLALNSAGLFEFVIWLAFVVGFVALTIYDARWMLLPNLIVYPLLALGIGETAALATYFGAGWSAVIGAASGMLIISGLFYGLYILSNGEWIGGGDVKLGLVLGLLAAGPMHSVLLLFVASVAGVLYALPQLIRGKAARNSQIPFGPFLIVGMLVVELFGSHLVDWYERLLS